MNPHPTPSPGPVVAGPESRPEAGSEPEANPEVERETDQHVRADLVLAGRHVSTGQYLAGLMAAAELETAGRVDRLPRDLFPDADPVLVQEVWERACAVVWRAAERYYAARQDPAVLRELQAGLEEAAHHAMAGLVGYPLRVARTAGLVHPADGRLEREHGPV